MMENEKNNLFKTTVLALIVGLLLGVILVFFWKELSIFFVDKLAFPTLAIVIFICFLLLMIISFKLIRGTAIVSYDKIFSNLSIAIKDKNQREKAITEITNEGKKYFSFWSLTRLISVFTLLIATILGAVITIQQNQLINTQNKLFANQNLSIEAERKSSLIFLMSNILDNIGEELQDDYKKDSIRNLSPELLGRIIALTHYLKPYKYVENEFTTPALSPERGLLFMTLLNSNLDFMSSQNLFQRAKFEYSDLRKADIMTINPLKEIHLSSANLMYSNLQQARIDNVNLMGANFYSADLSYSHIRRTNLFNVNFSGVSLLNSTWSDIDVRFAMFSGADLRGLQLLGTMKVNSLDWFKNLIADDVKGAKELSKKYKVNSIPQKDKFGEYFLIESKATSTNEIALPRDTFF